MSTAYRCYFFWIWLIMDRFGWADNDGGFAVLCILLAFCSHILIVIGFERITNRSKSKRKNRLRSFSSK